ncbi:DUF1223 domain-containing protein [Phenylobacterium sp.]|uniref:DUF1223 domain-containing protein n=1 Tax=Phenylobacterium sp. TaxID=1871053 RepID=UPI002DEA76F3|nr:DUF1223 domain-containing protein [Phenylobacterium sp.]
MTWKRAVPLLLSLTLTAPARAADAAHPVVVELFQSQGCSSCPPANANLLGVVDRPEVLALSFGVTYWDELGWKDTFASPKFTARQWDYAHGLGHSQVFTPQVVVNGRQDGVGADSREFQGLIARGERAPRGPDLSIGSGQVAIGAGATAQAADVWLVRYDPRLVQVPIKRGENGGKTLPHRNVVRELTRLGAWRGAATRFALPPAADPALKTAILIQLPRGGAILAAARG